MLEGWGIQVTLVTHYLGNLYDPGHYVGVYTRDREQAVYGVGDGIYVAGLVRVQGRYIGSIFYPTGYGPGDDITHDAAILKLCDEYFPKLKGKDWIGGDTGGDYY